MLIKKKQWPIFIVMLVMLTLFFIHYIQAKNWEFVSYIGVIVFFLVLIIATNSKTNYHNFDLWGLTLWALLHMSGGSVQVKGERLYNLILIPLSESYEIFKYDQFVHIVGFGVATLLMYHIIRPHLKTNLKQWVAVSIVIVMAGLGVGAFNEILEFGATVVVSDTGVGGYKNTSLDLVADLIGAIIALIIIRIKESRKTLTASTG